MRTNLYSVILLVLFSFCIIQISKVKAQTLCTPTNISIDWIDTIDYQHLDDIAWDIEPIDTNNDGIKDDGFIVAGETAPSNPSNRQALIIHLNRVGHAVWIDTFGGNLDDVAYAVEQLSNGNFLLCGSYQSTFFGGSANKNVWLFTLNSSGGLIGTEHQYGGSGNDNGYNVIEDLTTHNYIVVGGTGKKDDGTFADNGITLDSNSAGEYWIFAVDPSDYSVKWQVVEEGGYPSANHKDFAKGIYIDHQGNYIVTGFCPSCDSDYQMQDMLVKLDSTGAVLSGWPKNYGDRSLTDSSRDQGGHNVIEVKNSTAYSYLSTGVSHPNNDCNGNHQHDVYVLRNSTTGSNVWSGDCNLDEGLGYGGSEHDEGYRAAQTCDGDYLIAGDEASAGMAYDVTCHNGSTATSDIWLLKINSSGTKQWDESLGDVGNDEAHSIKKCPDGSYVIAGEFENSNNDEDFYVVKFELTAPCSAPAGLTATPSTYCETLSWTMDPCVPRYKLLYRQSGGSWNSVPNATSPYVIYSAHSGSTTYNWGVTAYCSPKDSASTGGTSFTLSNCSGTPSCSTCVRLANDTASYNRNLLSVYPNPSDRSFEISLQLNPEINQNITAEILDQAGKSIRSFKANILDGSLNEQISVNNFPAGFYYVKVTVSSNTYLTKFIIQ